MTLNFPGLTALLFLAACGDPGNTGKPGDTDTNVDTDVTPEDTIAFRVDADILGDIVTVPIYLDGDNIGMTGQDLTVQADADYYKVAHEVALGDPGDVTDDGVPRYAHNGDEWVFPVLVTSFTQNTPFNASQHGNFYAGEVKPWTCKCPEFGVDWTQPLVYTDGHTLGIPGYMNVELDGMSMSAAGSSQMTGEFKSNKLISGTISSNDGSVSDILTCKP